MIIYETYPSSEYKSTKKRKKCLLTNILLKKSIISKYNNISFKKTKINFEVPLPSKLTQKVLRETYKRKNETLIINVLF